MSDAPKAAAPEATFRSFSSKQASEYTQARGSYPKKLYDFIVEKHKTTGGETGLVVDVGCGPGNVTRDVARYFDKAIGVDAGDGMISTAAELGGETKAGAAIEYLVGTAEGFDKLPVFEGQKADLITAGTAVSEGSCLCQAHLN
jgi:trans-aconitate 3-methyltransferase